MEDAAETDIGDWLEALGLGKYAGVFAENEIDLLSVRYLEERDLETLGIPMGPRKRLLHAIAGLADSEADSRPAVAPQAPTAERRRVAIMFADLADYTKTTESLGDERAYELMQSIIGEMTGAVHRHAGSVEEFAGDGILALFGAQSAQGDAALRACLAALDLQERIAAQAKGLEASFGVTPRLRVGLHIGPVVVGHVGDERSANVKTLGDTVNLASRLEALAEPGTVAMSKDLRDVMAERVEAIPLGEHALKGKARPQTVYQLRAVHADMSSFDASLRRGLSPLVGRIDELNSLTEAWKDVRDGAFRWIAVTGEPGVGKSRLVHEFLQRHSGDSAYVMRGHCRATDRNTAFHPFVEIIRATFRLKEEDDGEAVQRKLSRGMDLLGIDPSDSLPFLCNLIGHRVDGMEFTKNNAEIAGRRTRDLIAALLRERCRISPTVIVIDDLQWIDAPSLDLLQTGLDQDVPLLILATARPPYDPPWANSALAREIALTPLPREQIETLLHDRLTTREVPPESIKAIAERAGGNPFFAEELANYLIDRANDPTDDGGRSASNVELPPTLQGLVMDRIGGLSAETHTLLEAASVFGPRFRLDIAAEVAGINGGGQDVARALEDQGIIAADGDWHRFRHTLFQSALYDNLLDKRRAELHALIGSALEHRYANALDETAEDLARHFCEAGSIGKAIKYLSMAGEKALRVYSLAEADAYFRKSLELCERDQQAAGDAFIVDTVLNVARVLYYQANFYAIIELVARHLPVAERLGDRRRLARCYFEIGYAHVFAANLEKGKPLLEQAWQIGEEDNDDEAKGFAAEGLLWHHAFWEPPGPATEDKIKAYAKQSIETGLRIGEPWLVGKGYAGLAQYYMLNGQIGKAREQVRLLFDHSRATGDPRSRVLGLNVLAFACAYTFEWEGAVDHAEESLRLSLCPLDRLNPTGAKGTALVFSGRAEEGMDLLAKARFETDRGGFRILSVGLEIPYGVALVITGKMQAGVDHINSFAEEMQALGNVSSALFGELALGDVYLAIALGEAKPDLGTILRNLRFVVTQVPKARRKAYDHLSRANALAENTGMPAFQAWALYDLARLELARGDRETAQKRLAQASALATSADADGIERAIDKLSREQFQSA